MPYHDEHPHPDGDGKSTARHQPLLVTVRQAGELLRCGKTHVFALINDGVLERRKLGSATRITMASIRKVAGVE